jgi:hypothetical protein
MVNGVVNGFTDRVGRVVEEREEGLLLKRAPDIVASAGALSEFGGANEIVQSLIKSRVKAFR